jgi:hypothetical protein
LVEEQPPIRSSRNRGRIYLCIFCLLVRLEFEMSTLKRLYWKFAARG